MKFKRLAAVVSAAAMLGSIGFALPVSAADENTVGYDLELPTNGNVYETWIKKSDNTNAQNKADFVVKDSNQTFKLQLPAVNDDRKGCRVKETPSQVSGVSLNSFSGIYIPFNKNVAVTEVSVKSHNSGGNSPSAALVALVKKDDYKVDNTNVNIYISNNIPTPLISSDNWFRCDKQGTDTNNLSEIDNNYSFTKAKTENDMTATLVLKSGETPQAYSGVYIDSNNSTCTIDEVKIKYAVAKIGSTFYDSIISAYAAVGNNETIELLADVESSERMTLGDSKLQRNKNITIKGQNTSIKTTKDILFYGNLTLNNVNIKADMGLKFLDSNQSLTIDNAKVAAVEMGKDSGILDIKEGSEVTTVTTRNTLSSYNTTSSINTINGSGTIIDLHYNSLFDIIDGDLNISNLHDDNTKSAYAKKFNGIKDGEKDVATAVITTLKSDPKAASATTISIKDLKWTLDGQKYGIMGEAPTVTLAAGETEVKFGFIIDDLAYDAAVVVE